MSDRRIANGEIVSILLLPLVPHGTIDQLRALTTGARIVERFGQSIIADRLDVIGERVAQLENAAQQGLFALDRVRRVVLDVDELPVQGARLLGARQRGEHERVEKHLTAVVGARTATSLKVMVNSPYSG